MMRDVRRCDVPGRCAPSCSPSVPTTTTRKHSTHTRAHSTQHTQSTHHANVVNLRQVSDWCVAYNPRHTRCETTFPPLSLLSPCSSLTRNTPTYGSFDAFTRANDSMNAAYRHTTVSTPPHDTRHGHYQHSLLV